MSQDVARYFPLPASMHGVLKGGWSGNIRYADQTSMGRSLFTIAMTALTGTTLTLATTVVLSVFCNLCGQFASESGLCRLAI